MKPNLLVAGDSFAEFPSHVAEFNSLEPTQQARGFRYDGWSKHWCEQWAESKGCSARSVGIGGGSNPQAINAAVRALAQHNYSHCVYFVTDVLRTQKRNTDHIPKGDRGFDARDYVERRSYISNSWHDGDWQAAITPRAGEGVERLGGNHSSLNFDGFHSRKKIRWHWIKYAMNLVPTYYPIQETIANLALLNSACASRGTKLMITTGFNWPQAVDTWLGSECFPKVKQFQFSDKCPVKPSGWRMVSHFDHKGHAQIFKYLRSQGLDAWLG